jgi:hypothetical protein
VDVNESEVSALVGRGYLPEEARGDPAAIKAAIEGVISDLAFELEQERAKGNELRANQSKTLPFMSFSLAASISRPEPAVAVRAVAERALKFFR